MDTKTQTTPVDGKPQLAVELIGLLSLTPQVCALSQSVQELIEAVRCARQEFKDCRRMIEELNASVNAQHKLLASVAGRIDELSCGVEGLTERQSCLEEASRQQTILSDQFFQQKVIEPLVTTVFPLLDVLQEAQPAAEGGQANGNGHVMVPCGLEMQLLELLVRYDISPVQSSAGGEFDPKCMQVLSYMPTSDPSQHMRIARSLRMGFQYQKRTLRPETVVVHRLTPESKVQLIRGDL